MAYGDDAGFNDWLANMGYVLPVDAPSPAVLRARGSGYIDATYEGLWSGWRTDGAMQELGWPRHGATIRCRQSIPSDVIPPAVVNASYRAGWIEATNPGALSVGSTSGQRIAREKVDVIEVAYHNDGANGAGSGMVGYVDGEIDGAMRAFICDDSGPALAFMTIGS